VSPEQFDSFIKSAAIICALGAVLNLTLIKRRGSNAILMALAFLFLGSTLFAYSQHAPMPAVWAGGIVVAGLLVADVFVKMRRRHT